MIADGSVSNAEFQRLNGVTGAIQTQLDAKQATISSSARLDASLIGAGTVSDAEFGRLNGVGPASIQNQLDDLGAITTYLGPLSTWTDRVSAYTIYHFVRGELSEYETALDAQSKYLAAVPAGTDAALIADGTVSNAEFQCLNGVTGAIQTQLDAKQATISSSARLDADLIGTGSVSNTELASLNGVSGPVQTQLNTKLAAVPAGTDAALIADGSVSDVEFQRLNGVTDAIQTQLDGKVGVNSVKLLNTTQTHQVATSVINSAGPTLVTMKGVHDFVSDRLCEYETSTETRYGYENALDQLQSLVFEPGLRTRSGTGQYSSSSSPTLTDVLSSSVWYGSSNVAPLFNGTAGSNAAMSIDETSLPAQSYMWRGFLTVPPREKLYSFGSWVNSWWFYATGANTLALFIDGQRYTGVGFNDQVPGKTVEIVLAAYTSSANAAVVLQWYDDDIGGYTNVLTALNPRCFRRHDLG